MKKIISVILSVFMMFSCLSVFAESHIISQYDFDGTAVGTWQNINKLSTVSYPDESNHCIEIPENGVSQIVNASGSAAGAYYGKIIFSGDIYPMTSSLNTQVFFKYYKLSAPKSGATVENVSPPHCIDFNGSNIKVQNNSKVLGKFSEGEKYSFKIVADGAKQRYDVYMSGEWDGEYHPTAEEESEVFSGYTLVDTYEYPKEYGAVGMIYIYSGKESSYVDNLKIEVPETTYEVSDFQAGTSDIVFSIDQFIDTDTISNLKLSRVADEVTELKPDVDYTLSWDIEMENYARAANPIIHLNEPVGEEEQIIFDFSDVNDTYGRSIGIKTALPVNPESEAINAVYDNMSENWLTDKIVKNYEADAPSVIIPQEGGSSVYAVYHIEGSQNTDDKKAQTLAKYENGRIIITQPETDDIAEDLSSFDEHIKITAVLSCGKQPERKIERELTIKRLKLLDMADECDDENVRALSDDSDETAWQSDNNNEEMILHFDKAYAVGGISVRGDYSNVEYEASADGVNFTPVTQYPVKVSALKITVTGEDGIRITELEPVTSSFYEDVMVRAEDLMQLSYNENLSGLTEKQYLTLPKQTKNGTPLIWSSSNPNVIDEYGTVRQKSSNQTVVLTAHAKDAKGNKISIAEKKYTATVAAKTIQPASGGGGGGGSNSLKYVAPLLKTPETTAPQDNKTSEDSNYAESSANSERFKDLENVTWAAEAVNELTKQGIINGRSENSFAPQEYITRAEFVQMIVGAFQISGEKQVLFDDVSANDWYSESVRSAAAAGIVSGISDTEFGVNKNILRQDIAVMLKNIASYKQLIPAVQTELPAFEDKYDVAEYALEAMNEMIKAEVISGYDGRLYPRGETTRAEAAVMLYRFLNNFQEGK